MNSPQSHGPLSGIDLQELDDSVAPQDDLFRHVTGKWMKRTPIPEDKARYGSFHILDEEAEKAVRNIITGIADAQPGTVERKVGDLFASFMSTDVIESRGLEPVASQIAVAANVASVSQLLDTVARLEREGTGGFVQLFVDNDPGDPTRYLVFFEQGGINLPDESYFRDEKFASVRDAYVTHIQRMFELLDEAMPSFSDGISAAVRAQRAFSMEAALAAVHWDNVRTRDAQATYNLISWSDLREQVRVASSASLGERNIVEPETDQHPPADLDLWLNALGAPEESFREVVVRQPSFLEGVGALLVDSLLEDWRDWLIWQVLHGAAPFLPERFVAENFDFYGRTLTGTPAQRERWKRGVSLVEGSLGEAVGRIYVERHFPLDSKKHMDVLVENLIEAYRQSITGLAWMSADTRTRALEKLEKFTPKIGYPAKWRDYSALEIEANDLMANVRRVATFELNRELAKIGKPIDRDEWFMTPQTVNAYYNPGLNEIVFPAAILQPPFFSASWDDATNYGSIGAVIGHEIGHGFDDQGSRYDGDGRLVDWWTDADRKRFEELTGSLIEQYSSLSPEGADGHFVNGELTIGENIGDLGGLGIAWKAYLISLNGAQPPVIDGLTAAQRFFISWANSWQMKSRPEETIRLLAIDPHSPAEFRCNQIVRNIDAFYEAFRVTEEHRMWLDPSRRVTIW